MRGGPRRLARDGAPRRFPRTQAALRPGAAGAEAGARGQSAGRGLWGPPGRGVTPGWARRCRPAARTPRAGAKAAGWGGEERRRSRAPVRPRGGGSGAEGLADRALPQVSLRKTRSGSLGKTNLHSDLFSWQKYLRVHLSVGMNDSAFQRARVCAAGGTRAAPAAPGRPLARVGPCPLVTRVTQPRFDPLERGCTCGTLVIAELSPRRCGAFLSCHSRKADIIWFCVLQTESLGCFLPLKMYFFKTRC